MPLLDRTGWKEDGFARERTSAGEGLLVPLAFAEAALAGKSPGQRIGVEIANTTPAAALVPFQDDLALIAIAFPAIGDGRGFSLGSALREQGFAGTLRATGALIPDQLCFALGCGFDEVEVDVQRAARQPVDQWLAAIGAVTVRYQQASDGRPSILDARRAVRS